MNALGSAPFPASVEDGTEIPPELESLAWALIPHIQTPDETAALLVSLTGCLAVIEKQLARAERSCSYVSKPDIWRWAMVAAPLKGSARNLRNLIDLLRAAQQLVAAPATDSKH